MRFLGRRVEDAENDVRNCKVHTGPGNLGLRADASLLAISNRFGALFMGGKGTLRWGWLAGLWRRCEPGNKDADASSELTTVTLPGGAPPFALALCADESSLVVTTATDPPQLVVFGVEGLLGGSASPLLTHTPQLRTLRQLQVRARRPSRALSIRDPPASARVPRIPSTLPPPRPPRALPPASRVRPTPRSFRYSTRAASSPSLRSRATAAPSARWRMTHCSEAPGGAQLATNSSAVTRTADSCCTRLHPVQLRCC